MAMNTYVSAGFHGDRQTLHVVFWSRMNVQILAQSRRIGGFCDQIGTVGLGQFALSWKVFVSMGNQVSECSQTVLYKAAEVINTA